MKHPDCSHRCSSYCRRAGCNCMCGEYCDTLTRSEVDEIILQKANLAKKERKK